MAGARDACLLISCSWWCFVPHHYADAGNCARVFGVTGGQINHNATSDLSRCPPSQSLCLNISAMGRTEQGFCSGTFARVLETRHARSGAHTAGDDERHSTDLDRRLWEWVTSSGTQFRNLLPTSSSSICINPLTFESPLRFAACVPFLCQDSRAS